jgi:hypothetical protein
VYTSSASVVFSGKPLHLVDEGTPYAATPMDFYTKTKVFTAMHSNIQVLHLL